MLQRACRRLNALDWPGVPRTRDFVVTCVDLEMENVEADLRAAVPDRELVEHFRRSGWLARSQ